MTILSNVATINVGITPNDGTGDNLRQAFITTKENFNSVYTFLQGTPTFSNVEVLNTLTLDSTLAANIIVANNSTVSNANIAHLTSNASSINYGTVSTLVANTIYVTSTINSSSLYSDVNSLTWKSFPVLTANNYQSYSPTITGAGAIGLWNIDIAGNASMVYGNAQPNITSLGILSGLDVNGNLVLNGNLIINGSSTTVTSNNLSVTNSLIYLAAGNNSDVVTMGVVGDYHDTLLGNVHTGLIRDPGTKEYYLFKNYGVDPTSTLPIFTNGFALTNLHVDTLYGNIIGNVSGTIVGTSSLATNLAGGSAMAIPYQTAANATSFLGAGTAGYTLQSNGTGVAPSWAAPILPANVAPIIDGIATVGTSTLYAREDHIHPSDTTKANIASPTLTGVPAAPTAALSTNTTQIATTAFVLGQAANVTPLSNSPTSATAGASLLYARQDHVHPTDSFLRYYDVAGGATGTPTANAILLTFVAVRPFSLPSGCAGSYGVAKVAATAQTIFGIQKNGATVTSMVFAAAATTATFVFAPGASFVAGDILTVVAPASPDATLADIGFTLAGTI